MIMLQQGQFFKAEILMLRHANWWYLEDILNKVQNKLKKVSVDKLGEAF